jgi:hypothetical protein
VTVIMLEEHGMPLWRQCDRALGHGLPPPLMFSYFKRADEIGRLMRRLLEGGNREPLNCSSIPLASHTLPTVGISLKTQAVKLLAHEIPPVIRARFRAAPGGLTAKNC